MREEISIVLEHLKYSLFDKEYPLTTDDKKIIYVALVNANYKYKLKQADYEAKLKADMTTMLEQLDSEIQEQIAFMGDGEEANGMKRADNLIKDKINALKQSIWQDNCNAKKE